MREGFSPSSAPDGLAGIVGRTLWRGRVGNSAKCRRCGSRTVGHLKVTLLFIEDCGIFGALSVRH